MPFAHHARFYLFWLRRLWGAIYNTVDDQPGFPHQASSASHSHVARSSQWSLQHHSMGGTHISPTQKRRIRIRYYRHSDAEAVRELLRLGAAYGPGSAGHLALQAQLTKPISLFSYALVFSGILPFLIVVPLSSIPINTPLVYLLGGLLSALGISIFLAYRRALAGFYHEFVKSSLEEDFKDIAGYYGMVPLNATAASGDDGGEFEDLVPSGPSCFWVAESYISEQTEEGCEIAGCIALRSNSPNPPSTFKLDPASTHAAELRRMFTHSSYRRLGVAALLIDAVLTHAREFSSPSQNPPSIPAPPSNANLVTPITHIYLKTTQYQTPAHRIYTRVGFVFQGQFMVPILRGWDRVGLMEFLSAL